MMIDIREIRKQPGSKKHYTATHMMTLKEIDEVADVGVDVDFINATTRIIVKGKLKTVVELNCSRCAEKFSHEINVNISEQYLSEESPEIENKTEIDFSDLGIFTYQEDEIDLEEMIRQNIIAALPMQPLCQRECLGLCPVCGENLNLRKCNCPGEQIDIRLSPLLKFKDK